MMSLLAWEGEDVLSQKIVEGARFVCAGLAIAWQRRWHRAAFIDQLCEVSVAALQTWLAFAMECGYVEIEVGQQRCDRYSNISAAMHGAIEHETALLIEAAT